VSPLCALKADTHTYTAEANPETKAFAAAYKSTVEEEDNEFAHLDQDDTERVLGNLDALAQEGEEEEDRGDEEDGMEEDEEATVDARDIRQLIRQRAQQPREVCIASMSFSPC
jgi:hypothetical protein